MRSITQGIRFPDEQIHKDRLLVWVERAMERWEDCPLLTDTARQLRDWAVASPSGEVGWYMQEGDEGRFTYARPKLFQGTAGLGVFFAGVYRASASVHLKSQARGLCQVVLDQLCRHLEPLEKARKIPEGILPLGNCFGTPCIWAGPSATWATE